MYDTKHVSITEELESGIRAGRYSGKLPSLRSLMAEYNVSMQTISKAVKPLSRRGLITPSNQGSVINFRSGARPQYYAWGLLSDGLMNDEPASNQFRLIQECLGANDGYNTMIVNLNNPRLENDETFWDTLPIDGLVFSFFSVTPKRAKAVRRAGIPAVTLHHVEPEYGLHTVEFDTFRTIDAVVAQLVAAGYRRIALQFLRPITGMRHARSHWNAVQAKYGIDYPEYSLPVLKEYPNYLAHIQAHNAYLVRQTPPEAVIFQHIFAEFSLANLAKLSGKENILAISCCSNYQTYGRFLPFEQVTQKEQWEAVSEVLHLVRIDNHTPLHRKIFKYPRFLSEIPPPGTGTPIFKNTENSRSLK